MDFALNPKEPRKNKTGRRRRRRVGGRASLPCREADREQVLVFKKRKTEKQTCYSPTGRKKEEAAARTETPLKNTGGLLGGGLYDFANMVARLLCARGPSPPRRPLWFCLVFPPPTPLLRSRDCIKGFAAGETVVASLFLAGAIFFAVPFFFFLTDFSNCVFPSDIYIFLKKIHIKGIVSTKIKSVKTRLSFEGL